MFELLVVQKFWAILALMCPKSQNLTTWQFCFTTLYFDFLLPLLFIFEYFGKEKLFRMLIQLMQKFRIFSMSPWSDLPANEGTVTIKVFLAKKSTISFDSWDLYSSHVGAIVWQIVPGKDKSFRFGSFSPSTQNEMTVKLGFGISSSISEPIKLNF